MSTYKELTALEAAELEKLGVEGIEMHVSTGGSAEPTLEWWVPARIFYLDRQSLSNRFRVAVE